MNSQDTPTPSAPKPSPHAYGPKASSDDGQTASASGCLIRMVWLVIGPVGMLAYLAHLLRHEPPLLSLASLGFWVLLSAMLVGRYVDVRHYDGATADGTAATMADFRRYAVGLLATGGVGWLAVALL